MRATAGVSREGKERSCVPDDEVEAYESHQKNRRDQAGVGGCAALCAHFARHCWLHPGAAEDGPGRNRALSFMHCGKGLCRRLCASFRFGAERRGRAEVEPGHRKGVYRQVHEYFRCAWHHSDRIQQPFRHKRGDPLQSDVRRGLCIRSCGQHGEQLQRPCDPGRRGMVHRMEPCAHFPRDGMGRHGACRHAFR